MGSADPTSTVPIGHWMHRSGVPFVSPEQFDKFHWSTLKPMVQELWGAGHQTLFYAEGNWNRHLDAFAELPDGSIVYHVDQDDIFDVHRKIGHKFCLSGGIPNFLLAYGKPEQVREHVKKVIDEVAQDGGYILDASAIVQNAATVENMQVMTDTARECGVYSSSSSPPPGGPAQASGIDNPDWAKSSVAPGVCVPWDQKKTELPAISGDEELVKTVWENVDALGNMYIWQCLLSF
jgi:hypothetical protein